MYSLIIVNWSFSPIYIRSNIIRDPAWSFHIRDYTISKKMNPSGDFAKGKKARDKLALSIHNHTTLKINMYASIRMGYN